MDPGQKKRVSFIEFLNAVPLGWGFTHGSCRGAFQILFDVPSSCAARLATGDADVGLIPAIEYQNIPGLRVIPDIAIASRREVRSVLFVSKVPLEQVESVALDRSSRSSVALLKIILHTFHGKEEIAYLPASPEPDEMLRDCDSALIIGNTALRVSDESLYVYDLAREWNRFTGLPFVFAFWAVRSGVELGAQTGLFYQSRQEGLRDTGLISRLYAGKLGLSAQTIHEYLTTNLSYSLDEPSVRGLQTFYELAAGLGLIASPRQLRYIGEEPVIREAVS
jgi:chorismate dehydratase